jgi:hypothetical protein
MNSSSFGDVVRTLTEKHCALIVVSIEIFRDADELSIIIKSTLKIGSKMKVRTVHLFDKNVHIIAKVFKLIHYL